MGHWLWRKYAISRRESGIYFRCVVERLLVFGCPGREFTDATQIDRPGVKIGVGQASTSDQFLTRTLKSAELVRRSGIEQSVEVLGSGQVDAWAASASNIQQLASRVPGSTIVHGIFMSDHSMIILPKKSSSAARAKIAELMSEAKKADIVTKAIE